MYNPVSEILHYTWSGDVPDGSTFWSGTHCNSYYYGYDTRSRQYYCIRQLHTLTDRTPRKGAVLQGAIDTTGFPYCVSKPQYKIGYRVPRVISYSLPLQTARSRQYYRDPLESLFRALLPFIGEIRRGCARRLCRRFSRVDDLP